MKQVTKKHIENYRREFLKLSQKRRKMKSSIFIYMESYHHVTKIGFEIVTNLEWYRQVDVILSIAKDLQK